MMKKLTLLLLLLIGVGGVASAYNNTYAVIVGVNDYMYEEFANDLPYSKKEARAFYDFLVSRKGGSVPASNICLLTDSEATKANIIYQAKRLFSKAKKNDRVIFFFTGHGGEGCYAVHDSNGFFETCLTYDDMKSIFKYAKSNTKLMFVNACHSGGIKGDARKKDPKGKNTNLNSMGNTNIVVMTASKSDEYSWYSSDIEMGVFPYYLIKGLGGEANRDGNGYITIQELYYYVYHNVIDKTNSLSFATQQTPQLFGKFDLRLIVSNLN